MPAPVLLDGASVHLWRASLDCAPPERERLASLLSEDEQARAARLRVPSIRERVVDLEIIRSDRDHTRLASRFFSAREVDALAALDPGDRMAGFFRCWTRKEAYLKARGEGLAIPLDSFSVSVGPEETACLLEADGAPAEAARWRIAAVDAAPGYAAALAVEGPLAQVEYFELAARF
jgi:4'-phosphopantetheinyl transferase